MGLHTKLKGRKLIKFADRHPPNEQFKMNLQSIASWWAGVRKDDDDMHLDNIAFLFGANIEKPRPVGEVGLHFTTEGSNSLEIDIKMYPNSLPVAIAKAVLAVKEAQQLVNITRALLVDVQCLRLEFVGKFEDKFQVPAQDENISH